MSDNQIIDNTENSDEELNDIRGFLYCLFNVIFEFYGKNYYKLGKAYDVAKRLASYSTSYPEPSEMLEQSSLLRNIHLAEKILFKKLAQYRDKQRREFFRCNKKLIKQTFNEIEDIFAKYTDDQIVEIYDIKLKLNKKKPDTEKNINITEDDDTNDDFEEDDLNDQCVTDNSNDDANIFNITINGDINVKKNNKYHCEKCKYNFQKKCNYDKHTNRKTPCIPEEKEKYDLNKRSCQYCSKILSTVYYCQAHMVICKYKPNDEVEKLKQVVSELSKQIKNCEKKPKNKNKINE